MINYALLVWRDGLGDKCVLLSLKNRIQFPETLPGVLMSPLYSVPVVNMLFSGM